MHFVLPAAFLLAVAGADAPAHAPFLADSPGDPALGEAFTQRWKVGLVIRARNGRCAGVFGTAAVPTDWPEQQVRIVEEEISPQARVRYRSLEDGGVRQMLVNVRQLALGETATALITFEVVRRTLAPPANPDEFTAPKKPPRDVAKHLASSPLIESQNPSIRSRVDEIIRQEDSAWRQVESIYDWVRDHVELHSGKVKGALAAMRDGNGSYEDRTSLFVAFCRAHKIPARTVWIPDHCYAEFYLVDSEGKGRWLPCQLAGEREFGGISERRPILQKGDNVEVPEKREPQRYVAEFLTGKTGRGMGQPSVTFTRQLLPN